MSEAIETTAQASKLNGATPPKRRRIVTAADKKPPKPKTKRLTAKEKAARQAAHVEAYRKRGDALRAKFGLTHDDLRNVRREARAHGMHVEAYLESTLSKREVQALMKSPVETARIVAKKAAPKPAPPVPNEARIEALRKFYQDPSISLERFLDLVDLIAKYEQSR